jgi:ElaB/YqjD/DUF883 family membrane-anchored ribosome-binding protein
MSTQPEALRLADALEKYWGAESGHDRERQAVAELRRLHAEVEELRGALDEAMWHVKYKELKAVNEELLEALKQHVQLHDGDCICQNCAAIAKATGEQA